LTTITNSDLIIKDNPEHTKPEKETEMPHFADCKDPARLIYQFLHLFNNESTVYASRLDMRPGPVLSAEDPRLLAWKQDLQQRLFTLSGMTLALALLLQRIPLNGNDTGLLTWHAQELAVLHPELLNCEDDFAEAIIKIGHLCRKLLSEAQI